MMFRKNKRKFLAVFVLRERETFHIIGKRKIRATTRTIRYRGGTYPVDVSYPTYTRKNTNVYFLDVKVLNQILMDDDSKRVKENLKGFEFNNPVSLDGTDSRFSLMSPQTLDTLVSEHFLRALLSSLVSGKSGVVMTFLIGIVAGVGLGWIIRDLITGGYF